MLGVLGARIKKARTDLGLSQAAFARVLAGHDAAVLSIKWNENDVRKVLEALRGSGRGVATAGVAVGRGVDEQIEVRQIE